MMHLVISKLPIFVLHCHVASNAVVFWHFKYENINYRGIISGWEEMLFLYRKVVLLTFLAAQFYFQCVDLCSFNWTYCIPVTPPHKHPQYQKHPPIIVTIKWWPQMPHRAAVLPLVEHYCYETMALLITIMQSLSLDLFIIKPNTANTTNAYLRKPVPIITGVGLRGS